MSISPLSAAMRRRAAIDLRPLFRRLPRPLQRFARTANRNRPGGRVQWGTLRRTRPFSRHYGFDRGTPVDRFYIERYLDKHAGLISGVVGEIKDDAYTRQFGGDGVTRCVVIDIDADNPDAEVIADLADLGSLPAEHFDCLVITQTLMLVDDPGRAVANCWQALRPGGAIIITTSAGGRVIRTEEGRDRWRFTSAGLEDLIRANTHPTAIIEVEACGNALSAMCDLMGIVQEEVTAEELMVHEVGYCVVACAVVIKPSAP